MPNYRSLATVTLANRAAAYEGLCVFLRHLDTFDVTFVSLIVNPATQRINIVTTGAIPAGQLAHLGIEEMI